MKKAILGKKLGMTQIFSANGLVVPVTVVEAGPCFVLQVKNKEKDGYNAVVVGFEDKRENLVNKPLLGQFKKANVSPKRYVKEFTIDENDQYNVGDTIDVNIFNEDDIVDVVGTTKGHGWSGVIKKWHFRRHRMTHGNGPNHRAPGSIGANTFPGKVFKGKKMSGRYGNERVTIQNLRVVKVDAERNVLLIKGAVPGIKGSLLTIKQAVKGR